MKKWTNLKLKNNISKFWKLSILFIYVQMKKKNIIQYLKLTNFIYVPSNWMHLGEGKGR